ncbi:MAG: hypothetical protein CMM50_05365 [Rhodospirillaceae bacterium]|nr:hypothetical protein [Rhodospirillaceae bacterium]
MTYGGDIRAFRRLRMFGLGQDRLCLLRTDGRIEWVSDNWRETGLEGSSLWMQMAEEDGTRVRAAFDRLAGGAATVAVSLHWLSSGAPPRPIELRAVRAEDGERIWCAIDFVPDRTPEQEALLLKDRKFAGSEELGRFGFWRYDVETGAFRWSEGIHCLVGAGGSGAKPSLRRALSTVLPADRHDLISRVRAAAATGSAFDAEHRVKGADGTIMTVSCRGVCETRGGAVVAVIGVVKDITSAKKTAARLQYAQSSLQSANRLVSEIMQNAREHIVAVDQDIRVVSCNESYKAMFERVIGRTIDIGDEIPEAIAAFPEQRLAAESNFRRALSGERFSHTVEYVNKAGEKTTLDLNFGPVRGTDGRVIGAAAVMRDIGERLRAEQKLKASERRFRDLIMGSQQGLLIHRDFVPLFANKSYARMFGFESIEEVLTETSVLSLVPEDKRERTLAKHRELLAGTRRSYRGRFRERRRDGAWIWVDFVSTRVEWHGAPAVLVTFLDVTERVLYAEQLEAERARYRREAVTDALTGIYNRRHFMDTAQKELERCKRHDHGYAVMMFDIDLFKRVNDTYGHEVGDKVLVKVSAAVRKALREEDLFGRLGGEEFAVLLPRADADFVAGVAERLRETVAWLRFDGEERRLGVTISVGFATGMPGDDIDRIMKRADAALYSAKESGRNRVVMAAA